MDSEAFIIVHGALSDAVKSLLTDKRLTHLTPEQLFGMAYSVLGYCAACCGVSVQRILEVEILAAQTPEFLAILGRGVATQARVAEAPGGKS